MARFLCRGLTLVVFVIGAIAVEARPLHPTVRLPVAVATGPSSVTVEPGDHLWKISASHLRDEWDRQVRDAEIWPYWRKVIETNLVRLRSGDADLIYPGEVIELPPLIEPPRP